MIPDDEEIREQVRRASREMAEHFVIAAIPKAAAAMVVEKLNEVGIDFTVLDDGEDDGIEAICAVPSSTVMNESVSRWHRAYCMNFGAFVIMAGLMVWALVNGRTVLQGSMTFAMFLSALLALRAHRQWEKRHRLQAKIAAKGF